MTDPFEALRAPVVPVTPDPTFAARLRERLTRAVLNQGEDTMAVHLTQRAPAWPPALTPSVLSTLLAGSFDYARMRGYDLLLLHDYSDALTQVFRRMRVFFGTTDDSRYYYIVRGANQAPLLPENSYLTALEGDIGL